MSVRQRQREFALLRAVGAGPGQVLASVVGQAAVVGALGSAVGIVGGIGLIALIRWWLARLGMDLGGDVVISAGQAAVVVALGTGSAALAAALPARRAATTPPVEAMRDDVVVVERSLRLRAGVGAVLLVGGVAAVVQAVQPDAEHAGRWLGVGAAGVLLGVLAVSPCWPAGWWARWPGRSSRRCGRWAGWPGERAAQPAPDRQHRRGADDRHGPGRRLRGAGRLGPRLHLRHRRHRVPGRLLGPVRHLHRPRGRRGRRRRPAPGGPGRRRHRRRGRRRRPGGARENRRVLGLPPTPSAPPSR